MARGTSLSQLRDMLRAELGVSSNLGMGVNTADQYDHILARQQQRLWEDFDWPFGFIERDEQLQNDGRYYTFDNDIDHNRIVSAHVKYGDIWHPLEYGICPDHYNEFDSDENETSEPALRWRHYEGNQFEVWPVPSTSDQILRFRAVKKLPPLFENSHTAVLDDNLIVLFAAAELLARTKADDAPPKLAQATQLYNKLKGNGMKDNRFIYGGGISTGERIRYIGGRAVRYDR